MSRPLRILHVIDSEGVYGAEAVLLDLCAGLEQSGQRPIIASIGTPRSGDKPLETAARERRVAVRPVRMAAGPSVSGAVRLVRLAEQERADVVHAHGYKADILLAAVPRWFRRCPLVITVHGYTDVHWRDRLALYNRVDRLMLRRADRVVLVHRGMADRPGLNRLHDPRWRVIENGIDLEPGCTNDRHPAGVPAIPGGSHVIGAIGRLSPEKGFDALLRAAGPLLQHDSRASLLILGEGPERGNLQRLADDLGIADRVHMPGYIPNARMHLRQFDVFVLPSRTEGLPVTLLEAMHTGVPVVATRVGGVPSVLDEGRGGLLVPPGDSSALRLALAATLDDRIGARDRVVHAQRAVAQRFSSRAMTRRYLDLYRELCSH